MMVLLCVYLYLTLPIVHIYLCFGGRWVLTAGILDRMLGSPEIRLIPCWFSDRRENVFDIIHILGQSVHLLSKSLIPPFCDFPFFGVSSNILSDQIVSCANHAKCHPWWLNWMHRPTGDQEVAGSTPTKVGDLWRLIVKYFLQSFSPFR